MGIKFLHLNIEGRKHLEPICSFLELNDIEVFCAQEIHTDTAQFIASKFGYLYKFSSMWVTNPSETEPRGLAIFSKLDIKESKDIVLLPRIEGYEHGNDTFNLLAIEIEKDKKLYTFETVHLPVNYPGDLISEFQLAVFERLKEELVKFPEFILTGDFNSPRGTIIFDTLGLLYQDNIPKEIDSTIDPVLHRAPNLKLVVDGVFTTSNYKVSNIKVVEGLSDHKGVTGLLSKI